MYEDALKKNVLSREFVVIAYIICKVAKIILTRTLRRRWSPDKMNCNSEVSETLEIFC